MIQYSNIIDPRLIEAIDRVAESIGKIADAYDRRTEFMFPVVMNCGTCRFFDRKNLFDGVCFVNGKEHVEHRRVRQKPCEQYKDFYE